MAAPRKFDTETRDRAVRLYREYLTDHPGSQLKAREYVGELLDVKAATLRNWVETVEVDAGERPGVPSVTEAELRELRRANAELRRADEILKTASTFFAAAELDRRLK